MCNGIVGNFCRVKKKKKKGGRGRRDNFRSHRCRCHFTSSHLASRFPSDSFQMHCRKARRTRGQCESNIGKQFFSGKNFSAAFQDFGSYRLGLLYPFRAASTLLTLRCTLFSIPRSYSASVVPAHFLRITFKPRSFLAIKECPRSFAVTYGRAGNNDKR